MEDNERELEFLIGDLEQENRLLRSRNERLEKELDEALQQIMQLQSTKE